MSKYFITIQNLIYGKSILDTCKHQFYLFLNPELFPNEAQIGYLNRVYKNKIRDYVDFDYYVLKNPIGKEYIQGYALKFDGIKAAKICEENPLYYYFSWCSIVTDYENIISQCNYSHKDFETVILFWYEKNSSTNETFSLFSTNDLRCNVCKRLLIDNEENSYYEYYELTADRNIEIDYIPEKLKKMDVRENNLTVLPYSKETLYKIHDLIKKQAAANDEIQKTLQDLCTN